MKSNYCKAVFAGTFLLSFFLIPNDVFSGWGIALAIFFMSVFSFSFACIVRNIKEKIKNKFTYRTSFLSFALSIVGISAFQVCGIGGVHICGASIGAGILSVLFPGIFMQTLANYGIFVIIVSIIIQLIALYYMGCLRCVGERCFEGVDK